MVQLSGVAACLAVVMLCVPGRGFTQAPAAAQTARPPKIATADFAAQPAFTGPILSPMGDRLLFHMEQHGKRYVAVDELATGATKLIELPEKGEAAWYRWAGNDRILASVATTTTWEGDDIRATRLFVYDIATGAIRFIGVREEGFDGDDVLYVDETGEWILLSVQKTIYDYPSVLRVDLATNKMKLVVPQRTDVWRWFTDKTGVVRGGFGYRERGWFMVYRKKDGDDFKMVVKGGYDEDDEGWLDVVSIWNESDEGFVLSDEKTGRVGVYKFNFATRELGDLVYDNATNDISGASLSEDGRDVQAVWYTDDQDRMVWFDPTLKERQVEIDSALKGRSNWIMSRSRDKSRMLVWTGASNNPGSYYIYVPEAGVMKRLAKVNEKLNVSQLATTSYVHYKARDGLEIAAYLTLPPGREAKGLPLVIYPHGGPFDIRDTLGYDMEVQFLANRGYAVLQPNYRGSGGYGRTFDEKAEGQWGRAMQDDLDDGMDWLVKSGTVDAKRVCIVGWSYGGYAALWGATRNPERYRCAASAAGVSDIKRQMRYSDDFFSSRRDRRNWRKKIQGPKDFDLDTVSPLRQVERLRVPVLIIHGDEDKTVPPKQSASYVEALKKAGKTYEYQVYAGEGHGLDSADNEKDWLDRLEAFLLKYNPAD